MNTVTCPVCQSSNTALFMKGLKDATFRTTKEEFDLYACQSCDAKFQHPFIPEEEVGKYYPNSDYHPFLLSKPLSYKSHYAPQSIYIRELMKRHHPGDAFSLIDVGCGGGTFLMSIKKYFPNASLMGVDISETAFQNLKTLQIDCIQDSLYTFETDKKFNYVVSSQVLEHLNQPYLFLEKIKKLSNPDTLIMIDVPATDSYTAKKYGRYWIHWDLPRHSILYSERTLRYLMRDFETTDLKHGGSILAIVSSRKLSKGENIYIRSRAEKFYVKYLGFLATKLRLNYLFSDKLIWIGKYPAP